MRKYQAFLKVVECGSFTGAADELNYTQSAVSQMIISLEKELNTTLFIRSKYGLQLTYEGEQMLPFIVELVDSYKNMNEKAQALNGLQTGIIRIATFGTFASAVLPLVLKKFSNDYPNIILETRQGHYREIEHWVSKDMVDFGITNTNDIKNFQSMPLFLDPFFVVTSKNHRLSNAEFLKPEQIKEEPFVSLDEDRDMEFLNVLRSMNVDLNVICRLADYNSVQAMVENELGISIVPKLASIAGRFNVQKIRLNPTISREIGLIYKNKNQLSTPSQIFINYLVEHTKNYSLDI